MKQIHVLLIFLALILFSSCNPKVITSLSKSYPPLDYKQDVVVFELDQAGPGDAEVLGEVKIGDTGFSTNCDYDTVIDRAKQEARKAGGNAIKIIQHVQPTAVSTCHSIMALILKLDNYEDEETMTDVSNNSVITNKGHQKIRIALNGGFSYRTAKLADNIQPDFRDYTQKLKSGYHFGADFTYFYNESFGFGFMCSQFNSSESMDNVYLSDNDGNRLYGKMIDNIKISYFGPSFSTRQYSFKNSNVFYISGSLGYMGFVNDAVFVDDFKLSGKTLGMSLGMGYDVKLSEDLSLGFQFSILRGLMTKYDFIDRGYTEEIKLEKGSYESLNRIDFSIGLVFGK